MSETRMGLVSPEDIRRFMKKQNPEMDAAERRGFWMGVLTMIVALALWGLLWLTMAVI